MMNEKEIEAYNAYMKFKRERDIVDEIMRAVEQTDEWMRIQATDPGIQAADEAFMGFLNGLDLAEKDRDKVSELAITLANAYTTPAILYGVNVVLSLQAAAANPAVLTALWQERRETAW